MATAATSIDSISDGLRGTTGIRTGATARFMGIRGDTTRGDTIQGGTARGDTDTVASMRVFQSVLAGVGAGIPTITTPSISAPTPIIPAMRTPGILITVDGGTIILGRSVQGTENGGRVAPRWAGAAGPVAGTREALEEVFVK